MSTKIYDAYKYNGKHSELVNDLQKISKLFADKLIKTFNINPYYKLDKNDYFLIDDKLFKDLELFEFIDILDNTMIKSHFLTNFKAECMVFFHSENIYVQFFGVNDDIINRFHNFSDFHYQDSTDPSNYDWIGDVFIELPVQKQEELTKDWENRKQVWEDIFKYSYNVDEVGLKYIISPINNFFEKRRMSHEILKKINDVKYLRKFKIKNIKNG